MALLDKIYMCSPRFIQNLFISGFNIKAYIYRYGASYNFFFKELSSTEISDDKKRFQDLFDFIKYAHDKSTYYKNIINLDLMNSFEDIRKIPMLSKENLRENISDIITIDKKDAVKGKTGGTTGISLEVYYTKADNQRRFANVNAFRAKFGYSLGKRTAWFSGKSLLGKNKDNNFWRTDYLFNVRYYSTFHINESTAIFYLENLLKYKPLYMIGFPSCMYELALFGITNKIEAPESIKAIFPNAETLTEEMRNIIETFFKSKIYDQYGSGEGAPHIFEIDGNYIFDSREGFLEVLDDDGIPAKIGNMIVTSYHTKGTPLIRYNIGDIVELEDVFDYTKVPVIKRIHGRSMSFIFSAETGKINAGNISNCTKNVKGITSFQVIQNEIDAIVVLLVVSNQFEKTDEQIFLENLKDRVGNKMRVQLKYVQTIPREKSGKFHIIKSSLK